MLGKRHLSNGLSCFTLRRWDDAPQPYRTLQPSRPDNGAWPRDAADPGAKYGPALVAALTISLTAPIGEASSRTLHHPNIWWCSNILTIVPGPDTYNDIPVSLGTCVVDLIIMLAPRLANDFCTNHTLRLAEIPNTKRNRRWVPPPTMCIPKAATSSMRSETVMQAHRTGSTNMTRTRLKTSISLST